MPLVTLALLLVSRLGGSKEYHYSVGFTVDALLVALLLLQILQLSRTVLWRWLDHSVTRYLGVISYPLYLYHGWGLSVGEQITFAPEFLKPWIGVLASIALASGSYFIIEKPFLRLKSRWEVWRRPSQTSFVPAVGE
jgi:peptidoglycan/LPS O-acetylase OafA/YrhL